MKNKSMILELIKKELRDIVRDRKTIATMIIIPLLVYPLMFGAMLLLEDSMLTAEETEYNKLGFAFEPDKTLDTVIEEMSINKTVGTIDELKELCANGKIDAYLAFDGKEFTIYYSSEEIYGTASLEIAYALIDTYKTAIQSQMLTSEGLIPDEFFNLYTINEEEISGRDALSEMIFGMVPSFIFITTILSAIFAATDMIAGEKERGTLETLFTFPVKTGDIIIGKYLAITICSMISSVLGFVSMYGVLYYFTNTLETFKELQLLTPLNFILVLVLFIVFAMLISALAIALTNRAKSFKEAQNATQPLSIIMIIPIFLSMMGIKLDTTLSFVPFLNVNLTLSSIISNQVNMLYFLYTIISNAVFIALALKVVIRFFKSDKVLYS